MHQIFGKSLLVLAALLLGQTAQAQKTAAGTVITNIAEANFIPPESVNNQPVKVYSNEIRTTVTPVCAVSVGPDGTVSAPGQQAAVTYAYATPTIFKYTIVNVGNTSSTFPLAARVESSSSFQPGMTIVLDRNKNGTIEADEPVITSITLNAEESAHLLLVVDTVNAAGNASAFVNIVSGCGDYEDDNNISQVVIGAPPSLQVAKAFTPNIIKPGDETTVTVTTTNSGQGEARDVVITDMLLEQIRNGLKFVVGSAKASAGSIEYTADGINWSATPSSATTGLRVRVDKLAPAAELSLSFRMMGTEQAENKTFDNVAFAVAPGTSSQGNSNLQVHYTPGVAIGPVGIPEASEGTPADQQGQPFAVIGQPVCFDHTLKNTGDVKDVFSLNITFPQGGAATTFYGENGQPLVMPVTLEPGQSVTVRVCYTATQSGPLEAVITVTGARGTMNQTVDKITGVEAGLPEVRKVASPDSTQVLHVGDQITYTLTVTNPYTRPLTNVVVSDPVPESLESVQPSNGGVATGNLVTWTIPTLAPGQTVTFTVTAKVSKRAIDGEKIKNVFTVTTTELPKPISSNPTENPFWDATIKVNKTVDKREVAPGDRLGYTLDVTNLSPTTPVVNAVITDTPAKGLVYIPGTSKLNGEPIGDPVIDANGTMTWKLDQLPPNTPMKITYDMRVGLSTAGSLDNTVVVNGDGPNGAVTGIASDKVSTRIKLILGRFAPLNDIIGMVYVDRNRNAIFDKGLDTPLERARLILAGGRLALTDKDGRYHFGNVPLGTQTVRLDPNTTPYVALTIPQAGGLPGTQTVHLRGLTSVDFPLAPLGGDISVIRSTQVQMGQLKVNKVVYRNGKEYVVVTYLNTPEAISGFELTDPLPTGATLKEGRNILSGTLASGETVHTYTFNFEGEPNAAVTDPQIIWR